jgi:hypothetical protein
MKHQGDHAKDQRYFFGSHLIERCELVMVTQDRIKRPKGKLKGKGNWKPLEEVDSLEVQSEAWYVLSMKKRGRK